MMEISLDSLVPFEKLENNLEFVFQVVERRGHAVLLKNNQPAYVIVKYTTNIGLLEKTSRIKTSKYTLQVAMTKILQEKEDNKMHAADLADEIYNRGYYFKKNGEKAEYNQIRARCSHYPNLFEALPGNIIKLRNEVS